MWAPWRKGLKEVERSGRKAGLADGTGCIVPAAVQGCHLRLLGFSSCLPCSGHFSAVAASSELLQRGVTNPSA